MVLPEVAPVKLRAVSSQSPELACARIQGFWGHLQTCPAWPGLEEVPRARRCGVNLGGGGGPAEGMNLRKSGGGVRVVQVVE